ncbi:MAG: hypothetical protein GY881_14675 [Gammaproteobacteria bacterium]|jgi:hypothetical protein|nr:hypothetical protein [Gammaproteobacteria bacterium]MCP4881740.1 hypothetical protein [Gammaproteobacteria bacterium]MDP6166324.1 hypothetical protein [Gammaproteobacteria bacterium]
MQCFIPFSEELVEQYPELKEASLVPYCEDFMDYTMKFEVLTPAEAANMDSTGFAGKEKLKVL